jgi:hypothetical protein
MFDLMVGPKNYARQNFDFCNLAAPITGAFSALQNILQIDAEPRFI